MLPSQKRKDCKMTVDISRKIITCDAPRCDNESMTKKYSGDRIYPNARGWIFFERDNSAKNGIIMGYRERHFCSRKCFDLWLKYEADNIEHYRTLKCLDDIKAEVCTKCHKGGNRDFLFPYRGELLCVFCHGDLNLERRLRKD